MSRPSSESTPHLRPRYHYTPAANWLSDPNGLVHDGTLWHMFYQHNPHGQEWGHMAWGHATSADLASWQEHPPALLEDEHEMVFSGSAVVDRANTAGFGAGAMVAIYTGAAQGPTCRQSQSLATSIDNGTSWIRHAANPVLDLGMADFRDPSVFWHEAGGHWVMVVALSAENAVLIFVSPNLKDWRQTCRIDAGTARGHLWECPALIELPVLGTDRSGWVLKVDVLSGAPGSGAILLVGAFDGESFLADTADWQTVDYGADFYAAIPWNGPRDDARRPAWIGWMGNHAYQKDFPLRGWRGVMSVPRRLALVERGGVLVLAQSVEPSVLALFDIALAMPSPQVPVPVACRIDIAAGYRGTLRLGDGEDRCLDFAFTGEAIIITRRDSALPFLACERSLPCAGWQGGALFVDSETCEFISADGTLAASFQHRPASEQTRLWADQPERVSIAPLRQRPAA